MNVRMKLFATVAVMALMATSAVLAEGINVIRNDDGSYTAETNLLGVDVTNKPAGVQAIYDAANSAGEGMNIDETQHGWGTGQTPGTPGTITQQQFNDRWGTDNTTTGSTFTDADIKKGDRVGTFDSDRFGDSKSTDTTSDLAKALAEKKKELEDRTKEATKQCDTAKGQADAKLVTADTAKADAINSGLNPTPDCLSSMMKAAAACAKGDTAGATAAGMTSMAMCKQRPPDVTTPAPVSVATTQNPLANPATNPLTNFNTNPLASLTNPTSGNPFQQMLMQMIMQQLMQAMGISSTTPGMPGSTPGATTTCVQDPLASFGQVQYPQGVMSNGTYCPAGTIPQVTQTPTTPTPTPTPTDTDGNGVPDDEEDDGKTPRCDEATSTKDVTTHSKATVDGEKNVKVEKKVTTSKCANGNERVNTVMTYTFKDGTTKTKETKKIVKGDDKASTNTGSQFGSHR